MNKTQNNSRKTNNTKSAQKKVSPNKNQASALKRRPSKSRFFKGKKNPLFLENNENISHFTDDIYSDTRHDRMKTPFKREQETIQFQEQTLLEGTGDTPLLEIKSGTRKSKKIHYATLKLGMQSVSDICEKAGFLLNAPQAQHITDYLYLLQKWNQSMNLVGKTSWKDVLSELVIDSLHLAKFLEENPRTKQNTLPTFEQKSSQKYVFNRHNIFSDFEADSNNEMEASNKAQVHNAFETWDLGAGAGLPGIPLRMFWQLGQYHMLEVREKRCFFLNTALTTLGLQNTHVYRGKAEDFMHAKSQKNVYADLILSRAFMPFAKMLPFVAPYLRITEDPYKTKPSIIFLTLEELDAKKYNSPDFSWETKEIYPYMVKNKKKFLCEVCFA